MKLVTMSGPSPELLPYVCPPGVDCAYLNSCPGSAPCPPGWLCASYTGHALQAQLDAAHIARYGGMPTTTDELPISSEAQVRATAVGKPGRWWEGPCPRGFFCATAAAVDLCPAGHWCPDGASVPLKCDALSWCPLGSPYQLNLAAPLLLVCLTAIIAARSWCLRARQRKAQAVCRAQRARLLGGQRLHRNAAAVRTLAAPVSFCLSASLHQGRRKEQVPLIAPSQLVIQPSTLTAVIGPSGCGKTTLLHALTRFAPVVSTFGRVTVTPQDDIIDSCLTVREALLYRARATQRDTRALSITPEQAVDRVLRELRLEHVRDVIIGYVEGEDGDGGRATATTQLSGGQRKRVSIGLDLVKSAHVLKGVDAGGSLGMSVESSYGTGVPSSLPARGPAEAPTEGTTECPYGPLLLLDEPTTGLDAAAAWSLTSTLSSLTQHGVTVLAALHQPRREIWEAVQQVVLMAPAGTAEITATGKGSERRSGGVAFCGPRELAVPYFCSLGLGYEEVKPHPYACEADWLLDVVHGIVQPPRQGLTIDFPSLWSQRGKAILSLLQNGDKPVHACSMAGPIPRPQGAGEAAEGGSAASHDSLVVHRAVVTAPCQPEAVTQSRPSLCSTFTSWLRQVSLASHRTHVIRMRDAHSLVLYMGIYVLSALVLSTGFTVYLQGSYSATWVAPLHPSLLAFVPPLVRDRAAMNAWDVPLQQLLFFLSSMVGSAAGLGSIAVFGARSGLLARDSNAGLSVTAQACGAMLAELLPLAWGASIFTGIWMLFAMPGPWWWWFGVIVGVAWCASGLAYLVSALTRPTNAAVLLTLLYTMSSVLSGVEPNLAVVRSAGPRGSSIGIEVLWYLSYATWAAEGAYAAWTRHATLATLQPASAQAQTNLVQTGADVYGYTVQSPFRAVLSLFALGVLWRVVAMYAQVRAARAGVGLGGAGAALRVALVREAGNNGSLQGMPHSAQVKVPVKSTAPLPPSCVGACSGKPDDQGPAELCEVLASPGSPGTHAQRPLQEPGEIENTDSDLGT